MENKTSKYFKYAIGEIILVVIGILIALQINNWNEQKKERKLENRYLNDLMLDLKKDSINLNEFVLLLKEKVRIRPLLLNGLTNNTIVNDSIFYYFRTNFSDIQYFSPNKITFEEIKNGSQLSIIKNQSLKKAITSIYADYDDVLKMEGYYERSRHDLITLLKKEVPKLEKPKVNDIYELKNNVEFLNATSLNLSSTRLAYFKKSSDNCNHLLAKIRSEIKK